MSEVDGQIGELNSALQDMRRAFDQTQDHWRDSSRSEFCAQFIEPIEQEWEQAAKALAQISSILSNMHSDCRN